jgi:6-pyruvoyltetrahydropterin/6-carboxytetrahydropterin synthase
MLYTRGEVKIMLLQRDFTFDAAHRLTQYHGKCEALHGHTYRLAVILKGVPDSEGMVLDFVELKKIVKEKVLSRLDHAYLNDLFEQPTAEYIARWVWGELEEPLGRSNCALWEVRLWETASSSVTVTREDMRP